MPRVVGFGNREWLYGEFFGEQGDGEEKEEEGFHELVGVFWISPGKPNGGDHKSNKA